MFEDDGAVGDLAPAWSPDGTQLAFSRSVREETALYRVSVAGGEAERIASVGPDEGYAVWAGVHWTTGDTILASVDPTSSDKDAGIWAIDVGGGEPRRVVTADPVAGPPILVAISVEGRALLFYPRVMGTGDRSVPAFALADPVTGVVEPVVPERVATSGTAAYRRVTAAAFSPDGARLLLAYGGLESPSLAVRDLTTGEEQALPLPSQEWPLATHPARGGVTWTVNGLVFAVGPARGGMLLRLSAA